MLAIPTTHSLGDLARAVVRPAGLPAPVVHAYCHDTDLLDARRRRAFGIALALLARRRAVTDLDAVAVADERIGASRSLVGDVARRAFRRAAVESRRVEQGRSVGA